MKIINPLVVNPRASLSEALSLLDENHDSFKSKKQYSCYKETVIKQFKMTNKTFPLLKIFHREMKPSYIVGYTITQTDLDYTLIGELKYWSFGICIFGYIGTFDPRNNVCAAEIYDLYNFINYEYLSSSELVEICHLDNSKNYPFIHICTNKSAEIHYDNFIFTPIAVAQRIYIEYKNVDNGGEFRLECHPHGGIY